MQKKRFHLPRAFHAPILRDMQNLRNEGFFRLIGQALLVGGGSGLVIGLFRKSYDMCNASIVHFLQTGGIGETTPFLVFGVLLLFALCVGLLVRSEPDISGSGIPHVELALAGRIPFPWCRIVITKFVGTLMSLSGGLSVGREGPSIQMGAAVGCGLGELFTRHHDEAAQESSRPRFLIAGSVAGLTAAFGAPLAGMLFAFEEVKALVTVPLLLFTGTAALSAWATVQGLGFGLVFPFASVPSLHWAQLWLALPLGLSAGAFSALYNLIMIRTTLLHDRIRPALLKPFFPFLCAGGLLYIYPQVLVGVGFSTADIAGLTPQGHPILMALVCLLAVKILFSVLSFASGVPGGLLMPMLAVGSLYGACLGLPSIQMGLALPEQLPAFLLLGMTGLFAGTVRAPLTGIALVAEMSGAFSCLPEMILVGLFAAATANALQSPPVYDSLKKRVLRARSQA